MNNLFNADGKIHRRQNENERHHVIPLHRLAQHEDGKQYKDGNRNDFLNDFQLRGRKRFVADSVGGNLKAVFKKRNAPTDENDFRQRDAFGLKPFEMTVPRHRHKQIGNDKQDNRLHECVLCVAMIA
jgi:hypothetical protein